MSVLSQFLGSAFGGATETSSSSNITLTVASTRVQNITMTVRVLSVTLPSATTLQKGGPLYIIKNKGDLAFSVLDGATGLLVILSPGQVASFSLSNNGTAAGTWVVGDLSKELEIRPYIPTIVNAGTGTYYRACAMSESQALVVYDVSNVRTLNVTDTSINLGTTLALAGISQLYANLISLTSTTALYVWTAYVVDKHVLHAKVITVTGTDCTAYATAVCLEGSGVTGWPGLARLTSTTVLANQGADCYVITVTGTTPSFGAKQATLVGTTCNLATISSTTVLATYGTLRRILTVTGSAVSGAGTITRAGNYHSSGVLSSAYGLTAIAEVSGYTTVIEQLSISGTNVISAGVYPVTDSILISGAAGAQPTVAVLNSTSALVFGNYTGTEVSGSVCFLVTMVSGYFKISRAMVVLPEVGNTSYQAIITLSPTRAMVFSPSTAGLYGNLVTVI